MEVVAGGDSALMRAIQRALATSKTSDARVRCLREDLTTRRHNGRSTRRRSTKTLRGAEGYQNLNRLEGEAQAATDAGQEAGREVQHLAVNGLPAEDMEEDGAAAAWQRLSRCHSRLLNRRRDCFGWLDCPSTPVRRKAPFLRDLIRLALRLWLFGVPTCLLFTDRPSALPQPIQSLCCLKGRQDTVCDWTSDLRVRLGCRPVSPFSNLFVSLQHVGRNRTRILHPK